MQVGTGVGEKLQISKGWLEQGDRRAGKSLGVAVSVE